MQLTMLRCVCGMGLQKQILAGLATTLTSELVMRLVLIVIASAASTVAATTLTIVLRHDWRANALDLLLLLLDFLRVRLGVRVQPRLAVLERVGDLFLLLFVKFFAEALVFARAFG